MVKSIRWRLQIWNAVILFLVVAGFGSVLYGQIRQARLDEIDGELHAAARVLEGALRAYPPHILHGGLPHPPPPPKGKGEKWPPPPKGPPPAKLERTLALPEHFRQRFEQANPFFTIWLADGTVLKASSEGVPILAPDLAARTLHSGGFVPRQRGELREVALLGPEQTQVLVGRSVAHELGELNRLAWQLLSTGLVVLGVGLVGGWLLSRRAVQPIETMSATAAAISADNLSERIDLSGVDSELARLGQILNAMFARLQRAFERQVQFTADASHELRTPLAIIHSHAELALTRPRSAEEYRQMLVTCLRSARRMKDLIDGLLTLARADAGRLELARQPLDLDALVEETVTLLTPLAEQAGVRLSVKTQPVAVTGDSGRLAQVVTNLVTNAIHYNHPEGEVVVGLEADRDGAVLTVADTGCGIPEEDRPHIFERFYRVDQSRSRERGGSGLGLAICKSIIEAHDGAITFTSALDRGTTFVVRLPRG
jgi:heavy metal sensor kinase